MSMNGNWLRVTSDELEHAKNDLSWAHELARAERDGESERWDGTGKAWNGIDFLLDRLGFETSLVLGADN